MGETIGQYFKQFGLTVACAVVFSTICAYTLTPMLSAYWLKLPDVSTKGRPRIVSMILRKFNFGV